jgi:hypothetical protein
MATNLVIDEKPCLLTETEKKIMDDILVLLIKHKLTSHQSQNLLERVGRDHRDGAAGGEGNATKGCKTSSCSMRMACP